MELFISSFANCRTFDIGALISKLILFKVLIMSWISLISSLLIGDISTIINDSTSSG